VSAFLRRVDLITQETKWELITEVPEAREYERARPKKAKEYKRMKSKRRR